MSQQTFGCDLCGQRFPRWMGNLVPCGDRLATACNECFARWQQQMEQLRAEHDVREYAKQFPTPNVLRAVALCEDGTLAWADVAALFTRATKQALNEVSRNG